MSADTWIALATLASAIIAGAWTLWRTSKSDDEKTAQRQSEAVDKAVRDMKDERDYWRAKADRLEERRD